MKFSHFIIIFTTATSIALFFYQKKIAVQPNEIDEFRKAISGMRPFIHPGTIINFGGTNKQVEGLIWSRYLLFPQRIDRIQDFPRDTTLIILNTNDDDSVKQSFLAGHLILWSNKGEHGSYYLIKKAS